MNFLRGHAAGWLALGAWTLALGSCVPPSGRFRCSQDQDCRSGWVCERQLCVQRCTQDEQCAPNVCIRHVCAPPMLEDRIPEDQDPGGGPAPVDPVVDAGPDFDVPDAGPLVSEFYDAGPDDDDPTAPGADASVSPPVVVWQGRDGAVLMPPTDGGSGPTEPPVLDGRFDGSVTVLPTDGGGSEPDAGRLDNGRYDASTGDGNSP